MNVKKICIAALLMASALAVSCAVEPVEDSSYSYDRVMKAWLAMNYPGLKPFGDSGAYILEMQQGTGPAVTDSSYVWAHYTKLSLDRSVISSNERSVAEQLGTYSPTSYYGSRIWRVDQDYIPSGLEAVIKTMKGGGRALIALPLSASSHTSSLYSAFSGSDESDNSIIEIKIDTVMADIYDYQERVMKEWFRSHYNVADTSAEHLYFKKLKEKTAETDSIPEGSTVKVRYIGRHLDGQVFDTNIEDTAKFYRIHTQGKTYDALNVTFYKDDVSKLAQENTTVAGFYRSVSMMNYGETAVALFSSELGYGEKGSSPAIPEYSPLHFWFYVEPKD